MGDKFGCLFILGRDLEFDSGNIGICVQVRRGNKKKQPHDVRDERTYQKMRHKGTTASENCLQEGHSRGV